MPASEVGSAVTVIAAEEIERRNPVAVLDLLRTVPGAEVTHAGGPGKIATVRVRGGSGAQALILVDGVRINSVAGGTVDFANLLAANIERIEVLRGPQATYGSEAMTGVISITTSRGGPGWRLNATGEAGTHSHRRFELGLLGAADRWEIRSDIRQIDLQSDIALAADNVLNVGFGTENRRGLSVGTFDEEADLDSWFVQDQWSITDNVHVTAAVRGDEHSTFGSETSHRVTLSGGWSDGRGRVHGSYGTAFRAPNFNELYFPFSGDPNLLPETTEGFDIGVQQRIGDSGVTLDLTWFDIDFDQLIDFDLTSFTFGNLAQASSSGAELTLRYRPDIDYSLELSHTYNRTEDKATGHPLARRPKNRTTAVAQLQPTNRFAAAFMAAFVADRIDSNGAVMDDYTKVDVHLSYAWSMLGPFVRIENLLDEDYFEVPGFVTPGRTIVVGVRLGRL